MGKDRYLPQADVIDAGSFYIQRLRALTDASEQFVQEVTVNIGRDYDEIDESFARSLVLADSMGGDPFGYFTLGKEIWTARDATTNDVLGFEVITRKRGGSIKLGPTIVLPCARGRGISHAMILKLFEVYEQSAVRKAYVTAPMSHYETAGLDFRHLGFRLEAVLRNHYKDGSAERVVGRFLRRSDEKRVTAHVRFDHDDGSPFESSWQVQSTVSTELVQFAIAQMQAVYDDIDEPFFDALSKSSDGDLPYTQKPKIVVELRRAGLLAGLAVCAFKRGGTCKVAPILLMPGYRNPRAIETLLGAIYSLARQRKRRKVLMLVPSVDWNIVAHISSAGGVYEGTLRDPYKPGVDVIAQSRFLN